MNYLTGEYFVELSNMVVKYALEHYDYYYLKYAHEQNRLQGAEVLIMGSSHAMNGIIVKNLPGGYENNINFSISSQDLYYDFLHIKKAAAEGKKKIKCCVINIGYYMLHQDLSLSKSLNYLIPSVYEPIFHDCHNYLSESVKPIDRLEGLKFDRSVYSDSLVRSLCDEWTRGMVAEQKEFYGGFRTRENNNFLCYQKILWNLLHREERIRVGKFRAGDHNRLRKRTESRAENGKIVYDMVAFLKEQGIIPFFVIFPFTKWYNEWIDPFFKEDIIRCIDELPFEVEFLDMNDLGIFSDMDFLDPDHLNDAGAEKATRVLCEYLEDIIFV